MRVGLALAGFHDHADQRIEGFLLALAEFVDRLAVGGDHVVDDLFQGAGVVHLSEPQGRDHGIDILALGAPQGIEYLFGSIVSDLIGDRRVLPLYLMGGLAGAVFYILSAQIGILQLSSYALGASAAVMAMGGAALILAPDYRIHLLLLGAVKVKYIVLVLLLLDLTAIAGQYDSGGAIAHLAGFICGCIFVFQLRDGRDWAETINRFFSKLGNLFNTTKNSRKKASRKKPGQMRATFVGAKGNNVSDTKSGSFQEKLDAILDKIKQTGYESLTQEEKDFLYEASQK